MGIDYMDYVHGLGIFGQKEGGKDRIGRRFCVGIVWEFFSKICQNVENQQKYGNR